MEWSHEAEPVVSLMTSMGTMRAVMGINQDTENVLLRH